MHTALAIVVLVAVLAGLVWLWRQMSAGGEEPLRRHPRPGLSPVQENQGVPPGSPRSGRGQDRVQEELRERESGPPPENEPDQGTAARLEQDLQERQRTPRGPAA